MYERIELNYILYRYKCCDRDYFDFDSTVQFQTPDS